jgi:hypothetical protein
MGKTHRDLQPGEPDLSINLGPRLQSARDVNREEMVSYADYEEDGTLHPPFATEFSMLEAHKPSAALPITGAPSDRSWSLGWITGAPSDRSWSLGWITGAPSDRFWSVGWRVRPPQQTLLPGVGYLDDATMVVVDHAWKMIFGKMDETKAADGPKPAPVEIAR